MPLAVQRCPAEIAFVGSRRCARLDPKSALQVKRADPWRIGSGRGRDVFWFPVVEKIAPIAVVAHANAARKGRPCWQAAGIVGKRRRAGQGSRRAQYPLRSVARRRPTLLPRRWSGSGGGTPVQGKPCLRDQQRVVCALGPNHGHTPPLVVSTHICTSGTRRFAYGVRTDLSSSRLRNTPKPRQFEPSGRRRAKFCGKARRLIRNSSAVVPPALRVAVDHTACWDSSPP